MHYEGILIATLVLLCMMLFRYMHVASLFKIVITVVLVLHCINCKLYVGSTENELVDTVTICTSTNKLPDSFKIIYSETYL